MFFRKIFEKLTDNSRGYTLVVNGLPQYISGSTTKVVAAEPHHFPFEILERGSWVRHEITGGPSSTNFNKIIPSERSWTSETTVRD